MMYVKYLEARKLIGRGQRQNELGTNFSKGGTNSSRIEERERERQIDAATAAAY